MSTSQDKNGEGLDVMSQSFADDFTRLLNATSKMYRSDSRGSFSGGHRGSATHLRQTHKSDMKQGLKQFSNEAGMSSTGGGRQKINGFGNDRREQLTQNDLQVVQSRNDQLALGQQQRSTSSAGKMINMDIGMNEIREVDENQIDKKRLRKRIKAIQQTRKQNQRVKKLQKQTAQLAKARSRDLKLYQQNKKQNEEQTTDFEREDLDSNSFQTGTSPGRSKRNPSFDRLKNQMRPPKVLQGGDQLSSSFNPKANQEMTRQLNESVNQMRRMKTGYPHKIDRWSKPPTFLQKNQSVPDGDFIMSSGATKPTPHWGRAKANMLENGMNQESVDVEPFEHDVPSIVIDKEFLDQGVSLLQDQIVASENLSDIEQNMFTENPQYQTYEEQRQIEQLKRLKSKQAIDPTEFQSKLLQAPFSPQAQHYNPNQRSFSGSQMRRSHQKDTDGGRWLVPGPGGQDIGIGLGSRMQNSNSEVKLECAREKRLTEGFNRRIDSIMENKNLDLVGSGIGEESTIDGTAAGRKQMILNKSLGSKVHGMVLQMPPQTSFDFKDQLRRPASAKLRQQIQIQRTQKAFERLQRQRELDRQQEAIRKTYQDSQFKDLELDQYSWAMPYKMKKIFNNEQDDKKLDESTSVADVSVKEGGKKKAASKSKKTAKGKNKKMNEDLEETEADKAYRILAEIAGQRRKQAEDNLYPEPDEKIFFSKPPKRSNQADSRREAMPKGVKKLGYNNKIFQQPVDVNDTLRLKLEQVHKDGLASRKFKGKRGALGSPPNSDLALVDDRIPETRSSRTSSQRPADPSRNSKSMLAITSKQGSGVPRKTVSMAMHQNRNRPMNADLNPMMRAQTAAGSGKSTFAPQSQLSLPRSSAAQKREAQGIRRRSSVVLEEENEKSLSDWKQKRGMLERTMTLKRAKAMEAIRRPREEVLAANQRLCRKHKMFGCECQEARGRRQSLLRATKQIVQFKDRTMKAMEKTRPKNGQDYKRIWEQAPSSQNTMAKADHTIYARELKMPEWKMILGYEDELVRELMNKRQLKLYDVQDVQKELEELTEDEDKVTPDAKEVWLLKKEIKVHIKRYNNVPPPTTLKMYRVGRVLGRGAYGKVNIARHKLSAKLCAVKSINMDKIRRNLTRAQEEKEVIPRITAEKEILTRLNHPNIVKLYETITHEQVMSFGTRQTYELIFMELCCGGSMLHYLRRRRRLDERIAKLFMKQLVTALGYLHWEDVVHRDIKLENILLSNLGELKICDFGVSVCNKNGEGARGIKDCSGTPAYMAPEVIAVGEKKKEIAQLRNEGKTKEASAEAKNLRQMAYGPECDVWSAGVVLYALIFGQLPFRGATVREIKEKILKGFYNTMEFESEASDAVRDLIKKMLTARDARISVADILQHEWLSDAPEQDEVTVFDESERAMIIKEYLISEDWAKWEPLVHINAVDYAPQLDFETDNQHLVTDNSGGTEGDGDPNMSERSEILAPNNTDQEPKLNSEGEEIPHSNSGAFDKGDKIDFCKMALLADEEYEREHDQNVDNGVYRKDANVEELAQKAGLKQTPYSWQELMKKLKEDEDAKRNARPVRPVQESYLDKGRNKKPDDLDIIDAHTDWTVCEVKDANPYSAQERLRIRGDLIFQCTRFGYLKENVLQSVMNNWANHQATTYYLLGKDHDRIC